MSLMAATAGADSTSQTLVCSITTDPAKPLRPTRSRRHKTGISNASPATRSNSDANESTNEEAAQATRLQENPHAFWKSDKSFSDRKSFRTRDEGKEVPSTLPAVEARSLRRSFGRSSSSSIEGLTPCKADDVDTRRDQAQDHKRFRLGQGNICKSQVQHVLKAQDVSGKLRKRLKKLRHLYQMQDLSCTGCLTKEQFVEATEKAGLGSLRRADLEWVYDNFDLDKTGYEKFIERLERPGALAMFTQDHAMESPSPGSSPDLSMHKASSVLHSRVYQRQLGTVSNFKMKDLCNSGKLGLRDMTGCCRELTHGLVDGDVVAALMDEVGTNAYGEVDYRQFVHHLMAHRQDHPRWTTQEKESLWHSWPPPASVWNAEEGVPRQVGSLMHDAVEYLKRRGTGEAATAAGLPSGIQDRPAWHEDQPTAYKNTAQGGMQGSSGGHGEEEMNGDASSGGKQAAKVEKTLFKWHLTEPEWVDEIDFTAPWKESLRGGKPQKESAASLGRKALIGLKPTHMLQRGTRFSRFANSPQPVSTHFITSAPEGSGMHLSQDNMWLRKTDPGWLSWQEQRQKQKKMRDGCLKLRSERKAAYEQSRCEGDDARRDELLSAKLKSLKGQHDHYQERTSIYDTMRKYATTGSKSCLFQCEF